MGYVIDRPNIQLDAADITQLTAKLGSSGNGFVCNSPNLNLDAHDLSVLNTQVLGAKGAVQTENLLLTAADVAAIATATGH